MTQSQSRTRSRQNPLRVLYACNLRPADADSEHYYEWEDPNDARAVMDSMRAAGCVVEPYEVTTHIASDLARLRDEYDIVFNNVEMVPGLDLGLASRESILPFYCASLGLPFTGSNFLALALTMDKRLAKAVAAANGIPTPRSLGPRELAGARLRYPCIVKPIAEGSSMGIDEASVARNRRELDRAVERVRAAYGDAWMVEEFVHGPELAMGILGQHVLDPVAVDLAAMPGNPLVRSHEVKHGEIDYVIRPEIAPERLAELKRFTWKMHLALGTRHYNRMEFIDDGRRFWLIEVNPLPDISAAESFLGVGASWWGIDFRTTISLVLWSAIEEYRRDPRYAERFAEERIAPLRRFVEPGLKALHQHLDGPTLLGAARRGPARRSAASTGR